MRLTDEREQFIRETGGGFADIAVLLGEVDALRGERDAITQESVANMAASIEFDAQLNAALARAEAAEAERDDLRKRLQSCAESVCAEERKTAFTEMIRAALAEPVEPSAKYGVNMTAAAALRELEPQPELAQRQCARCEAFDGHFEWCPSCAPTEPGGAT